MINLQASRPSVSNLASTYCALAILKIIGYDLSSIDSKSILMSMRNLQQPDGRYGETCSLIKWATFSIIFGVL